MENKDLIFVIELKWTCLKWKLCKLFYLVCWKKYSSLTGIIILRICASFFAPSWHDTNSCCYFLNFLDSGLTWRPTLASCFPEILMETTLASVTTNRKIFLPWVLNSKAVTGLEVSWTILDLLCLLEIKNGYQVCHIFLNIRTILKGAWTLGSCD